MFSNICAREFCRIRSHNHCKSNCKIKHSKNDICYITSNNSCHSNCNIKHSKNDICHFKNNYKDYFDKSSIDDFLNIVAKKYNFDKNHLLEINLTSEEKNILYNTILSDKAVSPKVGFEWLRYLVELNCKYNSFTLAFIIYAELLFTHRYDKILKYEEFIRTIKEKYHELCNTEIEPLKETAKVFKKEFDMYILKL